MINSTLGHGDNVRTGEEGLTLVNIWIFFFLDFFFYSRGKKKTGKKRLIGYAILTKGKRSREAYMLNITMVMFPRLLFSFNLKCVRKNVVFLFFFFHHFFYNFYSE